MRAQWRSRESRLLLDDAHKCRPACGLVKISSERRLLALLVGASGHVLTARAVALRTEGLPPRMASVGCAHGTLGRMLLPPPKVKRRRGPVPPHPFDVEHGTDTGALIPGEQLQTGHRHDRYITAYHGTAPSLFAKVMAHWRSVAIHPTEQTAFVDIGAGKGRAMLLASNMPFRRIVGVELHPMLAATLRENVDRWQQVHSTPPIRICEADAMTFRMPAGPCCLFLFNPFDLVLMDRFLERLAKQFAGREDDLDLVYVNDEQKRLIAEEHSRYGLLWQGRVFLSHADRDADKATIRHCADGLYVTSGYEDCSIYRLHAPGK